MAGTITEEQAKQVALEWASAAIDKLNAETHSNCKDAKIVSRAAYDEDLRIYDVVVEFWCRSIVFSKRYVYRLSIGANGKVRDAKYIDEGVDIPSQ